MEKYYRNPVVYNDSEIFFQAIEWLDGDENLNIDIDDSDDSEASEKYVSFYEPITNKYVINLFGVTDKGLSVCVRVHDFTPYFFIKVPSEFRKNKIQVLIDSLLDTKMKSKKGNMYYALKRYSKCIVVSKCILVDKYEFYGFTNNKKFKFLRLTFNNYEAQRSFVRVITSHNNQTNNCRINGFNYKLKIYEANLPPYIRLIHLKNLQSTGWIQISNFKNEIIKASSCQIEISTKWTNLIPIVKLNNAPILQASFDIETDSTDGHSFPEPTNEFDHVIQIATSFKKMGEKKFYLFHIITLKKCAPIEDIDGVPVILECYDSEYEVLLAWKRLLVRMDPDVIYGYNSDSFDCYYLVSRAILLGYEKEFLQMGRLKNVPDVFTEKTFTSSAYGTTVYRRLTIQGRINFDIIIFIKKEYKRKKYTLNSVATDYIGEQKKEMDYKDMFKHFKSSDPERIKLVAEYCIQDASLPQKIVDKLLIFQTNIAMSNVCHVSIKYLIERGQQIKTFSLILKDTTELGYLVPTTEYKNDDIQQSENMYRYNSDSESDYDDDDDYTGATVLKPKSDAYYVPVVTLDFKSLYPSIIMAHGLCYSSIVNNDKYLNIPGVNYIKQEWVEPKLHNKKPVLDSNNIPVMTPHSVTYAFNSEFKGVLPRICQSLVKSRQDYKDLMKKAYKSGDIPLGDVYDKCQAAVKVTMNSIYGFLAAQTLPCVRIAATVTALGRDMISQSKEYTETNYKGSDVVYGDSVTGDTPILLRDPKTNYVYIKTIDSISSEWTDYPEFKINDTVSIRNEKLYSLSNLEVWSNHGWNPIKKVIKHKTKKRIYRVLTHTGCIDVTEDHSLLDNNEQIVKPSEVQIGDHLLHSFPEEFNENLINPEWSTFKLTRDIPDFILNVTRQKKSVFIYKYYQKYEVSGYVPFEDKKNAMCMYYLMRSIGWNIEINILNHKDKIVYALSQIKSKNTTDTQIKKISEKRVTDEDEFVYDIETEFGTFHGGVGQLIVKNTDSIFIIFNTPLQKKYESECNRINDHTVITDKDRKYLYKLKTDVIKESMGIGTDAADKITKALFLDPIMLQFEKTNLPCLLFSKKRYVINKYEDTDDPTKFKQTSKGIILNRRDNFTLVSNLYRKVLDIMMNMFIVSSNDINQVYKLIDDTIKNIINNNVDLEEFIIVKTYNPPKKNLNLPQIVLAKKLYERDPGSAPRYGDKMPYVVTDTGHIGSMKSIAQYEKAEDPKYVKEHNIKLDTEYYIGYLIKPLCELLKFYIKDPEKLFKEPLDEHKKNRIALLKNRLNILRKTKKNIIKK